MMVEVEIYTSPYCPYCVRAKALLQKKGVSFVETDVSQDPGLRDAMVKRAGGRLTVPQIFIGDKHVGGCDDLYALDAEGGLDPLLGLPA
jgi:glutaredoxin 3